MNRNLFLLKNVSRKLFGNLTDPKTILFYLKAYALKPMQNKISIDAYILSYPKCGRTWLRMMVTKYVQESFQLPSFSPDLFEKQTGVPHVVFEHDQGNWVPAPIHYVGNLDLILC